MEPSPTSDQAASRSPSADSVIHRTFLGAVALGARQLLAQGFNVVGAILLANLLTQAEFGVYAIVIFLLSFLVVFGDVGLGASLVRQPDEPGDDDYRSIFTAQQGLVFTLVAAAYVLAPTISAAYGAGAEFTTIVRLVAISMVAASFQVIPSIRLERHLAFERLAVAEIAQAFVFNATAVGLAWAGWGAVSLGYAVLARGITGAVLINLVAPWQIGWKWNPELVRRHLAFGLPYQGVTIVSLLRDSLTPVFIGILLGQAAVGQVHWSQMVATYPLIAMFMMQRLYLPAFARMQAYPAELGRFVETVLFATNAVVAPLAILTLVYVEPITTLVFGSKWIESLPLFYLLWVANLVIPTTYPLMGLVSALGRSRLAFGFSCLWTVLSWSIGVPLVLSLGVLGLGIQVVLVQPAVMALVPVARRLVGFRVLPVVVPVWALATAVGALALLMSLRYPAATVHGLVGQLVAGATLYAAGLVFFYPQRARTALGWLRGAGPPERSEGKADSS